MSILYGLDLFGTLVFAISGVLTAVDKKFDLVGSLIIGTVTAIGGGTLRDLLIGQTPVGWTADLNYIWIILCSLPICYFFKAYIIKLRKGWFLFDTIGIGVFTILGLQKTLDAGLSIQIAITMGIVSAVFGGVIRDVLCNEIPLIFRKEIYATACLIGALTYVALGFLHLNPIVNVAVSMFVVIIIRYLSIDRKWSIPFDPIR